MSRVREVGESVTAVVQESQKLRAQLMLNRYIGRDLSLCLEENDALLDQVVAAVLAEWKPGTDVAQLWESYANAVERADDGSEYRATFNDSFGPLGDDVNGYLRKVWREHVGQLTSAKPA